VAGVLKFPEARHVEEVLTQIIAVDMWGHTGIHIPWKFPLDAFEMMLDCVRCGCGSLPRWSNKGRYQMPGKYEYATKMYDLYFRATVLEMDEMGNKVIERLR
jgi:hypothetical protein